MKKNHAWASSAIVLAVSLTALSLINCPAEPASAPMTGTISGTAQFSGGSNNAGITVTLEKTDGPRSLGSVIASQGVSRSIIGGLQTDADGTFAFTGLEPGWYTVYASSQNSQERAVAINVSLASGESITNLVLNLTPVGSISGQIIVDGTSTGNFGFLVSIAGTSYMAITDNAGNFTISDVPARDGYFIIVSRGNYMAFWDSPENTPQTVIVQGGEETSIGVKNLTSAELISSFISISEDGYWVINGEKTGVKAQGEQGPEGSYISNIGAVIEAAVQLAKQDNDGSEPEKALNIVIAIDVEDFIAMHMLFLAIRDYYTHLDLSAAAGRAWSAFPASDSVDRSKLLSLTLGENIKELNDLRAFTGLQSISALGVTSIGEYTFFHNTNLQSVHIPAVKTIGAYAFIGCTSLVSVNFPVATTIEMGAFAQCTSLESVSLPAATTIGMYAFSGCTSLESVNFPVATTIGEWAFSGCTSLESVSFPAATTIDISAFRGCNSLSSITIAANCVFTFLSGSPGIDDRFFLFFVYYSDMFDLGNNAAGTYLWDGSAWTGP